MKFNFRKITSVLASAVMLGSTAGFAAAAMNYPAPFVKGGVADVAVVVGASAASSDYLASVDLGQNLQFKLAEQTATSGAETGATTSGGDSVTLATSARKLYYNDSISAPRGSLSSSNLPSILGDGKFTDITGTAYPYTQTLFVGNRPAVFGTSGGDLKDPVLLMDVGTTATDPLYNYTISFSKAINVSDATGVQGRNVKILGVDYVIGASSTQSVLYLQGSGETVIIQGGESKTVTIGGVEHTIELVTTGSTTQAKISVDGSSRDVVEGSKYSFPGDIVIYVKSVDHPSFAGDLRQAELIVGANALRIDNSSTVKKGADETAIKGTSASITAGSNGGQITGVTVAVAMSKSQLDHLAKGESFTDPVFGGLKVQFGGAVPTLDDASRGKVMVHTDNQQFGYVTFTSAGAGTAGEKRVTYVYDNNTATGAVSPLLGAYQTLNTNGRGRIVVYEGEDAALNDQIVINQGDAGAIVEVTDLTADATNPKVTLQNVITGESKTISLSNVTDYHRKVGESLWGGNGYTIKMNVGGTLLNITWSSSTATRTLFPRIKLKDGGWLAFLAETSVANGTLVIFPDGLTTLGTAGTNVQNGSVTISPGNGIVWGARLTTASIVQNITSGGTQCNFNVSQGPALLFVEPKKWDDASFGNFICTPLITAGSGGTIEIAVGDPAINGTNSGYITWSSDTFKKQAVDKFGTLVTKEDRTNENGVATISYPSSQMYLDVLFTAESVVVTPGAGGTGGTATELGSVVVRDSEVGSVSEKNIIVIGGSCVNTVAAKLIGSDTKLCGSAFTEKSGVGPDQFLIKAMDSPYATGKIAMLVAGYEAADTTKAVKYLITNKPLTDAGTKIHKVTQTEADVASA